MSSSAALDKLCCVQVAAAEGEWRRRLSEHNSNNQEQDEEARACDHFARSSRCGFNQKCLSAPALQLTLPHLKFLASV